MAQRRMFSKSITNSGKFLKMPPTSRLLYYDLGMNADDDGFTEWFTVVRMTGSTEQDVQVLQVNGFVKIFDDNVLILRDWKDNNYIQKDRYTPSKFLEVYKEELKESGITIRYPSCIQAVSKLDSQVRLGKVRLGKVKNIQSTAKLQSQTGSVGNQEIPLIIEKFKGVNPSYQRLFANTTERDATERLLKQYGQEELIKIIDSLEDIVIRPFAPRITTPYELERNMGKLKIFIGQNNNQGITII